MPSASSYEELTAVNRMLRSIGETPVNSLNSGLPQASSALTFLTDASLRIQIKGWNVNTKKGYQLTKNADLEFPLPDNTLTVRAVDPDNSYAQTRVTSLTYSSHLKIARRRNAADTKWVAYDMINHRETWPASMGVDTITVDLVELLEFDDLPVSLQQYIIAIATREFQRGDNASLVRFSFSEDDVIELRELAEAEDAENEQNNVLQESSSMRDIAARRNFLWGR